MLLLAKKSRIVLYLCGFFLSMTGAVIFGTLLSGVIIIVFQKGFDKQAIRF
ncbi:MAG: hypothetical protein RIS29_369 [Bacteroidota bacterium]|jgi:hypothetical protein